MEKTKTVYAYDEVTNEYLGEQDAHLCPVTQAEYLIPAYSTDIAPPEHKDGFARVFSAGEWIYKEDRRGTPIYECATGNFMGFIDRLYSALTPPFTVKVPNKGDIWINGNWQPKPPPTKEEKKAKRRANIQSAMRAEADDLAFEVLAGEIDKQVWLDKRAEIKQRFPKEE